MQKFMFMSLFLLSLNSVLAQRSDIKQIKETIKEFALAGDKNNAEQLDKLLDPNYRIVMNQLFGSDRVDIMPRAVYLEKIDSREFGGDHRQVTFGDILVNGTTASAQITLKGDKSTFISLLLLVKDVDGNWKIISDVPMIS